MADEIKFTPDFSPRENMSSIKVIGVGGAGSNAVQHMFLEGIRGVDFLICNTDKCHLNACKIDEKLLIGSGSGAGGDAKVAGDLASQNETEIRKFIGENTQMLFIAAGMGKGTGTGASPVIAKVAKEMGILTIGVVTEPFKLEGRRRKESAEAGIKEMSKYVDSLIVINNQNLMKYFGELDIDEAYVQVDDILKNSVKSIAEIVTSTYKQNVDFEDVKATMKDSGKALLGTATANGEERVQKVLEEVLNCPLLENQDISNAKNFLFFITYGPEKKLTLSELTEFEERFEDMQDKNVHLIWGHGLDESLGDSIKLSVVVTNFSAKMENNDNETYVGDNKDNKEDIIITIEENPEGTVMEPVMGKDDLTANLPDDKSSVIGEVFDHVMPEPQPHTGEMFTFPEYQQGPQTVIENYGEDLDDDNMFRNTVNSPAYSGEDVFLGALNQRRTDTFTTEPEPYYEVQDNAKDLFFGIAD